MLLRILARHQVNHLNLGGGDSKLAQIDPDNQVARGGIG